MNLITVFMVLVSLLGFPRPPVPTVPFNYDPSLIPAGTEILKTYEVPPDNSPLMFTMKAYDENGDDVALTYTGINEGSSGVWIPPTDGTDPGYTKIPDSAGSGVEHRWNCDIRVGTTERVIYLFFTGTDTPTLPGGPKTDSRAVLINVKSNQNTPPILGIE